MSHSSHQFRTYMIPIPTKVLSEFAEQLKVNIDPALPQYTYLQLLERQLHQLIKWIDAELMVFCLVSPRWITQPLDG
jgi:hypothetical protein